MRAFADWLRGLPHPQQLLLCGNHDVCFEPAFYDHMWPTLHPARMDDSAVRAVLQDTISNPRLTLLEAGGATVRGGLRVWGAPYTPVRGRHAFVFGRGHSALYIVMMYSGSFSLLIKHVSQAAKCTRSPPLVTPTITLHNNTL